MVELAVGAGSTSDDLTVADVKSNYEKLSARAQLEVLPDGSDTQYSKQNSRTNNDNATYKINSTNKNNNNNDNNDCNITIIAILANITN